MKRLIRATSFYILVLICVSCLSFNSFASSIKYPSELIFGDPSKAKIKWVVISEGFTSKEMPDFLESAKSEINQVFNNEAFKTDSSLFSVYAVMAPSKQSTAKMGAYTSPLNTTFLSYFADNYHPRLLYPYLVDDAVAASVGESDNTIVLINSDPAGGVNMYGTVVISKGALGNSQNILIHELGHAYAGLKDEYPSKTEINIDNAPNVANNPFKVPWQQLLYINKVSIYPENNGAQIKYIPSKHCLMGYCFDETAFCPVCLKAIRERTKSFVNSTRSLVSDDSENLSSDISDNTSNIPIEIMPSIPANTTVGETSGNELITKNNENIAGEANASPNNIYTTDTSSKMTLFSSILRALGLSNLGMNVFR